MTIEQNSMADSLEKPNEIDDPLMLDNIHFPTPQFRSIS